MYILLIMSISIEQAQKLPHISFQGRHSQNTKNVLAKPINCLSPTEVIKPVLSKGDWDTLSYWNENASVFYYLSQPDDWGDINYSVRFSPVHPGTLFYANFYFYHLVDYDNSGMVKIHVWNDNDGIPGDEIGNVYIGYSDINQFPYSTLVDLSSLGIFVSPGNDFYIGYSLEEIDTLGIVLDTCGNAPERCYDYYPGYGWELTSSWGSFWENMTYLIEAYIKTTEGGELANIRPYQPDGWDGPIVPSSIPETHTNGPDLTGNQITYIDWAIVNDGNIDIPSTDTFYVFLYLDNVPVAGWFVAGLQAGEAAGVLDYELTVPPGEHTLKIYADSTNAINESDENDNIYSETFIWSGEGGNEFPGNPEYVIITSSSLKSAFSELAWWKTKKGVPAAIVTTEYIYANFAGRDNQEKIRNFIKTVRDSGAIYILLAGQCDWEHNEEIVPRRDVWCMSTNAGNYPDEDTIPCDMYYSNLDGNWDVNSNNVFGEMNDNVDLLPDIFVGRAPVKNLTQAQNFVNKVISYEKNPEPAYIKKLYLPQGNLWEQNPGRGMNDTIADIFPYGWQKSKQYEDFQGISRSIVNDSMNSGFQFQHWVGHGNEWGIFYNYGQYVYYYSGDIPNNTNGVRQLSIINSIACFTGAVDEAPADFDNDCLAERLVVLNTNAAVATMMNTRYGWGYGNIPGSLGPSGEITSRFYRQIFEHNKLHIGEALANAKMELAGYASTDTYFRWAIYEHTLFGDPEMPVWKEIPQSMSCTITPDSAIAGKDNVITINVSCGKAPVSNALVCLTTKDFQVYDTTATNSGGSAVFSIHPEETGTLYVTVTNDNYYPLETYIIIKPDQGVEEEFNIPEIRVPDVASKTLKITFNNKVAREVSIFIYDIQGRKIKAITANPGRAKQSAELIKLPHSGIYFVYIKMGNWHKLYRTVFVK